MTTEPTEPAGSAEPTASNGPTGSTETTTGPAVRPAPEGALARFLDPSLNAVVLVIVLLVCVRIGMAPLQDNSFLTHLATGELILDAGSVPTADPYSWTAHGDDWTVQSWLASVIYAGIDRLVGLGGIRVLSTLLAMALAVLLWKLTEPAEGLLARSVAMALPLVIGVGMWVERPFMFGAVGLALVLLAAQGRLDPRWLVPVMWVWANTHGSFPFAPVVLVLLGAGRFLDERVRPDVEIRCLAWTVAGMVVAMVGPLGPKVLTFPFQLLGNTEAFTEIREWQPLDPGSSSGRFFLIHLLVAAIALVRVRRWRMVLPAVVFAIAAVSSTRNILQASIVLTPIVAEGLRGVGSIAGASRPRLARPVVHALSVVVVVAAVLQLGQRHAALDPYPREAAEWMRRNDLLDTSTRVVSRDVVGNYLEYAYGPEEVRVFIDDRVDMYPLEVVRWYLDLIKDGRDHAAAIAEIDPTAILWDHDSEFGRWLQDSEEWDEVWRDDTWMVAVPAGR